MTEHADDPDLPAKGLSDDALKVVFGWFPFDSKSTLNIHPPHASMKENQAALDELLAIGAISHERDERRDIHVFKGSTLSGQIRTTPRAKALIRAVLGVDA